MSLDSILREPSGKNLFDISNVTEFYNIPSEKSQIGWGNVSNKIVTCRMGAYGLGLVLYPYMIKLKGSTTYTLSADCYYTSDGSTSYFIRGGVVSKDNVEFIESKTITPDTWSRLSFTITPLIDTSYYILIQPQGSAGHYYPIDVKFKNIQFELGSTATSYEPYHQGPETVTIPYSGKNLIKFPYEETTKTLNGVTFTVGDDGGITVSGTATDTTVFTINSPIQLEQGKQYTLSGYRQGGGQCSLQLHSLGDQQTTGISTQYETTTFTANYTQYYAYLVISAGVTLTENVVFYPQLEEGITATDFSLNTGNKEVYKVSYGSRNLFDISSSVGFQSYYSGVTSTISGTTISVLSTANRSIQLLLGEFPAGTYTISFSNTDLAYLMLEYGEALEQLSRVDGVNFKSTKSHTFTLKQPVKLWLESTISAGQTKTITDIQIELGNKATEYVPYNREVVWKSTSYNLLPNPTSATQTITGITFTNNSDGTITVNGTATANSTYNLGTFTIPTNYELKLSGCPSGGSTSSYYLYAYDTTSNKTYSDTGSGVTFTSTSGSVNIYIRVQSEQTVDGLVFEPKLEFV